MACPRSAGPKRVRRLRRLRTCKSRGALEKALAPLNMAVSWLGFTCGLACGR